MFRNDDHAIGYLEAIIDGEGHVSTRSGNRAIVVVNTEIEIIERTEAALTTLGVQFTRFDRDRRGDSVTPQRKHQWQVTVATRAGLETLQRLLCLCPRKQAALAALIAAYRPRPQYDEAARLYAQLGSYRAVADRLGVPYSTAQLWISTAGVERRPPGRPRGRKWSDSEREARMRR